MSKGSVWRKWDLHVHTPASYYNNFSFSSKEEREKYKGNIWEKYVDELEKIQDVAVIGITDYFSIEGYKKILEYRQNGRLKNFDLLLPNIEFRVNIITNKNNRLNLHVIFSDDISVEDIDEFLSRVNLIISDPYSSSFQHVGCTERGLVKVGRHFANDENLPDEKALEIGFKQAVIEIDQLLSLLEKTPGFSGKYLIIMGEDCHGGLSEIPYDQAAHLRTELYRKCHVIESSNRNTIDFWLGKSAKITIKELLERFGGCKPCIRGSDSHSFDKLCKNERNLFCWIKADPTFEGLKQIIYEPEERVRIQEDNPEPRKSIYSLSSVKISNSKISDELEIEEQKIELNSNLIAVIGGKGNGKTALLDLIANCFEDRCKRSGEDKNSFVQRIEDQKPDLDVEISFIGNDVDKFSKQLLDMEFFRYSKITYLPQGKIEEYSGDRTKLHEKIKEIIFNNQEVIEFEQEFKNLLEDIKILENEINNINSEIYKLEENTNPEIEYQLLFEKSIKVGELIDKEKGLSDFIKNIEENSKDKVEKLKEEENSLRLIHSKLESIENNVSILKNKIEEESKELNSEISKLNSDFMELGISVNIPPIDLQPQLEATYHAQKLIESKIKEIKNQIKEKEQELDRLSGIEKTHANLLKEIEKIKIEINLLTNRIEDINKKKIQIQELDEKRREKYEEFIRKHIKLKSCYEKIIEKFSKDKDKILSNIDFKSNIFFDQTKFEENLEEILDLRRVPPTQIRELSAKLNNVINSNIDELKSKIEEYITYAFKLKEFLKGKGKGKTRTNLDFYNLIFGNYFSLNTEIFFNRIPMEKLSMGQKGTVLLKIFLAEGDHPLIIDQPEENLDNKFVYEDLVSAFREAKKKRQVIIATHNANLVVNTDAEQVIVAEFKNNKISYKSGSIENREIRNDITLLLEGGKEAFKRREEKYGILALRNDS